MKDHSEVSNYMGNGFETYEIETSPDDFHLLEVTRRPSIVSLALERLVSIERHAERHPKVIAAAGMFALASTLSFKHR